MDKSCIFDEYLDYSNSKCRKRLIDKLVTECEYEILSTILLNTTDTVSIADKSNCLINIILLTILCLISLAIVSISCYSYYRSIGQTRNTQCYFKYINTRI